MNNASLLGRVCFAGFLSIFLGGTASSLLSGQTYEFKVIQSFQPNGSNNVGAIVGQEGAPIAGIYAAGEFLTAISDPMLPKGGGNTVLYGINDKGVIVGSSDVRGFILKDGVFTTVTVMASITFPVCINDAGTIGGGYLSGNSTVGFVLGAGGLKTFPDGVAGINNHNDLLFGNGELAADGVVTPIAFPGALNTAALGLNDSDSVVGFYTDMQFVSHGFVYRNGTYTTVDYPNATFTRTQTIDNAGRVAGFALTPSGLVGFTAKPTP